MNPRKAIIAILARLSASLALADDFKIIKDQKREASRNVEIMRQQQRAVRAKAESIRIPHIELRDVTIREEVEFLAAQGRPRLSHDAE